MFPKYGWIPDKEDKRDFLYAAIAPWKPLPSFVDLRQKCSPVEDQASLGSCTGQAFAGALEFMDRFHDNEHTDVSRLFIYYNERKLEDTIEFDNGAYIRDGIKALAKWGACDEALWPYDIAKFAVEPPPEAYADGLKRRIKSYYRITSLNEFKTALSENMPVTFGFKVYESFEGADVARSGIMSMPRFWEKVKGGHAVLGVGYDDSINMAIIRNSWSRRWGKDGYFFMPYQYIDDPRLSQDFWVIRWE